MAKNVLIRYKYSTTPVARHGPFGLIDARAWTTANVAGCLVCVRNFTRLYPATGPERSASGPSTADIRPSLEGRGGLHDDPQHPEPDGVIFQTPRRDPGLGDGVETRWRRPRPGRRERGTRACLAHGWHLQPGELRRERQCRELCARRRCDRGRPVELRQTRPLDDPSQLVWSAPSTDQGRSAWSPDGRGLVVRIMGGLAVYTSNGSAVSVLSGCSGTPVAFAWADGAVAATSDQGRLCAWRL